MKNYMGAPNAPNFANSTIGTMSPSIGQVETAIGTATVMNNTNAKAPDNWVMATV